MKKSISKNYMFNLIYQVLNIIIPLVTMPYVSRVLGAEGIGVYSYTYSIITYFTLFAALGTVTYAQREIAYIQNDKEKYTKAFWEIFILRAVACIIASLGYIIVILNSKNVVITLVQGLYLLGIFSDISWFFQGLEEFAKIVIRNIIMKILNLVFIFVFVKNENDLVLYILGMALFPVIANFTLWMYLPKYLTKVCFRILRPFRHLKETMQLFIPTMAIQIYTIMDKTMIGLFTSDNSQNGYYEQAIGMVRLCLLIITSLGTVMAPRIANTFAQGEHEKIREYMQNTYKFVWLLGMPMLLGLIAIADLFVPWFFGPGYDEVIVLIQICSGLIIATGLNDVTGIQYLVPTKKQNVFTVTVCIGAATNFCFNIVFIPILYAKGAAIASVLAESVIAIAQFIYIIYIQKKYCWKDIFGKCWKNVLSAFIMFVSICGIKYYMKPNIVCTMLSILFGGIVYLVLLRLMKDEMLLMFIYKVIEILKARQAKKVRLRTK